MKIQFTIIAIISAAIANAQTNPAILHWIQNPQGTTGSHYVAGNSTLIQDNVPVNVQTVQYSDAWVYVSTNGIPAYPTGPFQDGNPSQASDQNAIYKISLNPQPNTGTPTNTNGGNIGIFINGVSLFDYRDGVSWNNNTQAEGGGPIMGPPGQGVWNRDAIVAERVGFDCAKGHPAMGNYHHHQNPSAFDMDLVPISDVCDLYASDGLYVIDANAHSPLIGYAYDGYPIYGAYGFLNTDGSGGVTRIKSSYQLRNITERTTYADGTSVTSGPPINATYPLGRYREDYEYIAHSEPDFLDEHNGRFCVTPEYPNGIYAYFCTVDENWNSAYPYVVGPTFYGVKTGVKVNSITEAVTTYNGTPSLVSNTIEVDQLTIFPNPSTDFVAAQMKGLNTVEWKVDLLDACGKLVLTTTLYPGSTIAYFDTRTLYSGEYVMVFTHGQTQVSKHVQVVK
jgi:YHYH protein